MTVCFYETDLHDNKDKNQQHQPYKVKTFYEQGDKELIKYGVQVSDPDTYLPHHEIDSFKTNIEILRTLSDNLLTSETKNEAYNNISISENSQTWKWTNTFVEKVRQVAYYVAMISGVYENF